MDPITNEYPELTPYQFASNTPIWAIDYDGLEARVSTYAAGRTEVGDEYISDRPMFKKESFRDVEDGIAKSAEPIFTSQKFIDFLVDKTKKEGSISYFSIFSHGTSNDILFDNGEFGREAIDKYGRDYPAYGYKNNIGIQDISNNPDIKFEPNALCVFAGCNLGSSNKGYGKEYPSFAAQFTFETGIASIGSLGNTSPQGDDEVRTSDYGYYLFQKIEGGKVLKTNIGKELTQEKIENIYNFLNKKEIEPIKPREIKYVE